jgi:hypothetical protein
MKTVMGRIQQRNRFRGLSCLLGGGLLLIALIVPAYGAKSEAGKAQVFKLREVSMFEKGNSDFERGQASECKDQPLAEVKAYPDFKSAKPIYGTVRFGAKHEEPDSGLLFHFAVDESEGTGTGHDRFYFDLDRDLNLRNDAVVLRRTPAGAKPTNARTKEDVHYGLLRISFEMGAAGQRLVEIQPRLVVSEYEGKLYNRVSFVRTRYYEGDIKIGSKEFAVTLGSDFSISGRMDVSSTALILEPKDHAQPQARWWGADRLMAVHKIDGRFFTFSASPIGDELTVRPYDGELGTLTVGPGKRSVEKLAVRGSLQARERAVAVGDPGGQWSQKAVRDCRLPIGDYLPAYLTFDFGRLRIGVSQNYHSDGKPRDRAERPLVYGIQIRKDKPFVLDFANRPDVMFASPAKGLRIKRGEEIQVKAVLVDPGLDLMIRDLDDTTRKQTKDANGKALGYERDLSLDPTVLITRANGEKVAEGVMPFG